MALAKEYRIKNHKLPPMGEVSRFLEYRDWARKGLKNH